MTPPTTDTSREAVRRYKLVNEPGLSGQMVVRSDGRYVRHDDYAALLAKRDALRDRLASARNEALEEAKAECEAQRVKCNDNGQFEAAAFCKNLLVYIDALKSATPAPRKVTVQEAARVLLEPDNEQKIRDALEEVGIIYSVLINTALRALANEEQSDE